MLKAYKYRIYPNQQQAVAFEQHFGCVRFVYNWALALQNRYYKIFGKSLSRTQIQSQLVKKKKTSKFAWLNEVNSQSLLNALLNVHTAFTNFFKGRAKFPRFKSKKIPRKSYQCPQHCTINFEQGIINLPKIKGIKTVFSREFIGNIKTVTISKTAHALEDLAVKNMVKNRKLAKVIHDVGLGQFVTLLTYKANWYGKNIVSQTLDMS